MDDLKNRIECAGTIIKDTLSCFDLYLGVDAKTNTFIFFDRRNYPNGKCGTVPMEQINIKGDK